MGSNQGLNRFLESVYSQYHSPRYLGSDPLGIVHRYHDPWDQEGVAILAALLAYGKVAQIRSSIEEALRRLGASPREGLRLVSRKSFRGFKHRFNTGADLVILFRLIAEAWISHGSVGALFSSLNTKQMLDRKDASFALDALMDQWKTRARDLGAADSFHYLLTAPKDGSACKRWLMLLRWMGRKDALDLGLWQSGSALVGRQDGLDPAQLLMPLDTHTGKLSQLLGLTSRKTLGFKAVQEVTFRLRGVDPSDPTRFDFALARLGILDLCQKRYHVEICTKCSLLPVCQIAKRESSPSP